MSKSTTIESAIARLAALKLAPRSAEAAKELRAALAHKVDYLVERAAAFITEFKLPGFATELAAAFRRLTSLGIDHGFAARTALAGALHETQADTPDVFLTGISMYGAVSADGVDSAAPLRGICAMALVRLNHPRAMIETADLLADQSRGSVPAQVGAIRALALSCEPAASLLLRVKLRIGSTDAEVVGECLSALMQLDPVNSLRMVKAYLDSRDETVAESAALALGESRRREALDALLNHYVGLTDAESRRPVLLAISLEVSIANSCGDLAGQSMAAQEIRDPDLRRVPARRRIQQPRLDQRHAYPLDLGA